MILNVYCRGTKSREEYTSVVEAAGPYNLLRLEKSSLVGET